jgi:hypothetical protein
MALALRPHVVQVTVHWVPGYSGIPGNEKADALAKLATECQPTTRIPISTSWLRRRIREQTVTDWQQWYDNTPRPTTYAAPTDAGSTLHTPPCRGKSPLRYSASAPDTGTSWTAWHAAHRINTRPGSVDAPSTPLRRQSTSS